MRSSRTCLVQRFGSALNLNVHLHVLLLDGVYTDSTTGPPTFHPAPPPTDEEVAHLLRRIRNRVLHLLERDGHLEPSLSDEPPTQLELIAAASIQGHTALRGSDESSIHRLGHTPDPSAPEPTYRLPLCAALEGFSLHAAVRVRAGQRARLQQLCRYVTRPALASGRLTLDRRGHVLLRLKRPFRDGTTHLSFTPLAFLERLTALIPPPRAHLLTYHGVLAPASSLRSRIVPLPPPRPLRSKGFSDAAGDPRYSWAELLKRVFGHDVLRCSACGNRRLVIALLTQPDVIPKILDHVGLPSDPPALQPARPPPGGEFDWA